jgi:hypothetical protein
VSAKPWTVSAGILTSSEFAELSLPDRMLVEAATQRLILRYGGAWLLQHRARLREELSFFCGVPTGDNTCRDEA